MADLSLQTQNICITVVQCWTNVGDVGPTLYKFYTNVLYLLGSRVFRDDPISKDFLSKCHNSFIYENVFVVVHVW